MAYPWSKPRWHDTDARRRCDMQKALPLSAQAGYARRKPSKHHVLMRFRSWPQRDSGWCVSLVGAATSIIFVSSLAGVATSIIFVATKVLSRQNTFFVATNTWEQVSFFLSRQVSFVVTDKHVTRKTFIMSRQIHRDKSFESLQGFCRDKNYICGSSRQWYSSRQWMICLARQKFVAAKDVFCRDFVESFVVFVPTKIIQLWQLPPVIDVGLNVLTRDVGLTYQVRDESGETSPLQSVSHWAFPAGTSSSGQYYATGWVRRGRRHFLCGSNPGLTELVFMSKNIISYSYNAVTRAALHDSVLQVITPAQSPR